MSDGKDLWTINTYGLNGKFTLMRPFTEIPLFFETQKEAETYAKNAGLNLKGISIENERVNQ